MRPWISFPFFSPMPLRWTRRHREASGTWASRADPGVRPTSCAQAAVDTCLRSVFNRQIYFQEGNLAMPPTRRTFLTAGATGGLISALGFDLQPAYAQSRELKIARTTETRSTCPYCSVSCGVIIHTIGDKAKNVTPQVVHVEGDPDHPINRGTLCPKGSSLEQDILNERRLLKPQVRRPGRDHWEDIAWDQAIDEIGAPGEEDARRNLRRQRRAGPHRQPLRRHRLDRRLHRHQRVQLPGRSRPCAAWGSATWKTRPGFDTAPRSPVWGPRSDAVR